MAKEVADDTQPRSEAGALQARKKTSVMIELAGTTITLAPNP